jgi:hypothetical protein
MTEKISISVDTSCSLRVASNALPCAVENIYVSAVRIDLEAQEIPAAPGIELKVQRRLIWSESVKLEWE